jgi:hypothetical protein
LVRTGANFPPNPPWGYTSALGVVFRISINNNKKHRPGFAFSYTPSATATLLGERNAILEQRRAMADSLATKKLRTPDAAVRPPTSGGLLGSTGMAVAAFWGLL